MTVHLNRLAALSAAAATSVVLLAGCGTSTPAVSNSAASSATGTAGPMPTSVMSPMMSGAMPSVGGMSTAGMPMPAQPAGPHNQADITFTQQMSVHHQGAITMADLAATRASSSKVKTLAVHITAAQAPELKEMAGWLAAWAPDTDMNGMPNKTAASMGGMGGMASGVAGSGTSGAPSAMPGMMTDAQMAQLMAATGTAFDKLFLQMMIVHHQGALTMAKAETAQGQNPAALTLAKSIIASQTAQITQMQDILKTL